MIKASRLLLIIFVSLVLAGLLVVFVYGYDLRPMYLSDIFFFVGAVFFFPGLISVTGVMEIFASSQYLSSKVFSGKIEDQHHFKSLDDYKEFKKITSKKSRKRVEMLIVGLAYIIIAIILSYC